MIEIALMFTLQVAFHFFRSLAARNLIAENIIPTILLSNIVAILYLGTTYLGLLGINDIIDNGNWGLLIAFLLGGSLGIYLNFKFKIGENNNGSKKKN